MASKGDTYENDLLKLLFNATAIANVADNAATGALTVLEVGLHTSSPGESGSQTTNEAAYGNYARVPVNRNSGGWTVTGSSVSPAADIVFAAANSGSETETHSHVGSAHTSTGKIFYWGTVTPNLPVSTPVAPRLTTASAITED